LDRPRSIQIHTSPVTANVYLNGSFICEISPCKVEALPILGGYVQVSKSGYMDEYVYFDFIDAIFPPHEIYNIGMQPLDLSLEKKHELSISDPIASYEHDLAHQFASAEGRYPTIELLSSIPVGFVRPTTKQQHKMESNIEGVLAILYDYDPSTPLDMCIIPCALNTEVSKEYRIVTYKHGYLFKHNYLDSGVWDADKPMVVKFYTNWLESYQEKARCHEALSSRLDQDREAEVCQRAAAPMPKAAERSGHCKVKFDVSPEGKAINVEATYCSDKVFKKPTIKTVRNWYYYPKVEGGKSVEQKGLKSKMTFRLADKDGNQIPEPNK